MKTRRLSDKKIHIACDIDIVYGDIVIETISTRLVYSKRILMPLDENGTGREVYYPSIKPAFIAREICGKYGIKMKYVHTPSKDNISVDIDGECIKAAICHIKLTDAAWYVKWNRDQKINSLLE